MEENLSTGKNLLSCPLYGVLDVQGSLHDNNHHQHPHALHQHQHHRQSSTVHPHLNDVFPLSMRSIRDCDQTFPVVDYRSGYRNSLSVERGKTSTSDEDEPSFNEDVIDGNPEVLRGKKVSSWQRMKWTDGMVRLLITVVSCIGEDAGSECGGGGRRKFTLLQKKGKWKSVSKVMAERGCYVSPQQCEDKFNDLNKRYKRLTDMLGRGTSCKVVENPSLLASMDHLSEKAKEDARKILSSKHLFYEEMCSYHNGNRLHLPIDPALQRCLQSVLKTGEERDPGRNKQDDINEGEQEDDTDERDDEPEENNTLNGDNGEFIGMSGFPKRTGQDPVDVSFGSPLISQDCNKNYHPQNLMADMNNVLQEGTKAAWVERQWMRKRLMQLEDQKLSIQVQVLELEKQRFKWRRFSRKKDRELDKLRMENEIMKAENVHMALELKRKELYANCT